MMIVNFFGQIMLINFLVEKLVGVDGGGSTRSGGALRIR